MKAIRFHFWTTERLEELIDLYPKKLSLPATAKHFKQPMATTYEAWDFYKRAKIMTLEISFENGIRITKYAPAYCYGVQASGKGLPRGEIRV